MALSVGNTNYLSLQKTTQKLKSTVSGEFKDMHSPLVCSSSCQLVQYLCRKAAGPCTAHTAVCRAPQFQQGRPFIWEDGQLINWEEEYIIILFNTLVHFHLDVKSNCDSKKVVSTELKMTSCVKNEISSSWCDHPFKLRDTEEKDKILLGALALNLPFL